MKRIIVFILGVLMVGLVVAPASWAGGSREKDREPEPAVERATGPLAGEVVGVQTLEDGSLVVTVRQPDRAEVDLQIPAALARSLRVLEGDQVRSTEHQMARDGERLRVQTLDIQRNR